MRAVVPCAHRFGCRSVADENRVDGCAEDSFDEQRRRLIGADEIAQRSKHRAFAELLTLTKQASRGRRESNALSLECIERVDLSLERRVCFVGAEQLRTGCRLAIASLSIVGADLLETRGAFVDPLLRILESNAGALQLPIDRGERVGKLSMFGGELLESWRERGAL